MAKRKGVGEQRTDIAWLVLYRGAMIALLSLVLTMVGWQSSRIIARQDEAALQIAELRTDVSVQQTTVMNLTAQVSSNTADTTKVDVRLTRTNERQTEMGNDLAVMKSQLEDLRVKVK